MDNLLFPLLLCHFLADFVLQTDKMASVKKEHFSYHKMRQLGWHVFTHFCLDLLAIVVYFCWFDSKISFWALLLMVLGITIVHFIIDLAKAPVEKRFRDTNFVHLFTYIIDQILHITTIYIAVWLVLGEQATLLPTQLNNYSKFCALASLVIIIVYFVGYLIPYILEVLMPGFNLERKSISVTKQNGKIILTKNQEIPVVSNKELKAGRYIGGLERLLLLIFMVLQIYSAIPIIIALKTLARFKELENNRTFAEYYLIGNFLSMIFGVLISLVFIYILHL
ncbi:DUF3307 domain-containing protein [Listeria cornellensis]|uniref:DUF3307 domain-containing protein n=1 Tax=Listeria cornellensis FSL F6-0969 TaxID=1265820 RepID=W7BQ12_9LIST|nr:DUF3307 domain-containing protein [Listeria cornellensis]EUJ25256.1 hypothetical protein PCORN_17904 [Listeria cornellensis FSL F6-0969]